MEGGRYDHEPINIYSGAQVVCKIYSEPLWSYSEPFNFVPNPALFCQPLYFCYLIYQFTLGLNNFTKLSRRCAIQETLISCPQTNKLRFFSLYVFCLDNLSSFFLEYVFVNIKYKHVSCFQRNGFILKIYHFSFPPHRHFHLFYSFLNLTFKLSTQSKVAFVLDLKIIITKFLLHFYAA